MWLKAEGRQIRETVACDIPLLAAIERVDQCAAFLGLVSKVIRTSSATCSSVTVRTRPGCGASESPSRRSRTKRRRHLDTVSVVTATAPATALVAVVIDDKVVNAPMVFSPITNGKFQIVGYTQQSANDLVDQLTGE